MFATHARDLRAQGWSSIIPLVPGDKRPFLTEWPRFGPQPPSDDQINDWIAQSPNAGIGLAFHGETDRPLAIDIDRLDPTTSQEAIDAATTHLGQTPLVRVGRAPKTMLFYRQAEPIRSRKLHHAGIEIFGSSGQVVLFAIHPQTKRPYAWPDQDPRSVSVQTLPPVAEGAICAFLSAIDASNTPTTQRRTHPGAQTASHGLSGDLAAATTFHRRNPGLTVLEAMTDFILASELRHPAMTGAVIYAAQSGIPIGRIRDTLRPAYEFACIDDDPRFRRKNFEDVIRWAKAHHIDLDLALIDTEANRARWGRFAP